MTSEIEFHSDGFGERRHAAVNVKDYSRHTKTRKLIDYYERLGIDENEFWEIVQSIYDFYCEIWWGEDVQEYAKEAGFAKVYSEGRSGGWAVPVLGGNKYLYEENFENDPDLIKSYEKFAKACKADVANIDATIYDNMVLDWFEREEEFLLGSVYARMIKHN